MHQPPNAIDAAEHTAGMRLGGGLAIEAQPPQKQLAASVDMHSTDPVAALILTGTRSQGLTPCVMQNQSGQALALPAVATHQVNTG
jgi:hypothetical protein